MDRILNPSHFSNNSGLTSAQFGQTLHSAILGTWQCGSQANVRQYCQSRDPGDRESHNQDQELSPGCHCHCPCDGEAETQCPNLPCSENYIRSPPVRLPHVSPLFSKLPSFKCKLDKYRGNSRTSITASAGGINYSGLYRYFTVRRIFYRQRRCGGRNLLINCAATKVSSSPTPGTIWL